MLFNFDSAFRKAVQHFLGKAGEHHNAVSLALSVKHWRSRPDGQLGGGLLNILLRLGQKDPTRLQRRSGKKVWLVDLVAQALCGNNLRSAAQRLLNTHPFHACAVYPADIGVTLCLLIGFFIEQKGDEITGELAQVLLSWLSGTFQHGLLSGQMEQIGTDHPQTGGK